MTIVEHSSTLAALTSKWFNDQTTSDLQVRLRDDRVIYCHRLWLRSWSKVWDAALEDEKATSLDLTSHDAVTVEMCLKYCYTSTIDLTDDNVTRVHLFVHQYDLKELRTTCEQRIAHSMGQGLSASNCMGLYGHMAEHKFPGLPDALQSLKEFVCREFVSASKSDGFLRFSVEVLCQLLKEDELNTTEDDVLDACLRWLEASPVGTDPQVRERVLQLVRFPMLSAEKLIEFSEHPLMSQYVSLRSRHNFALKWIATNQVGSSKQEPLRIKLKEENKTEILTPRIPFPLQIESQILDVDMTKTLFAMLGYRFKVGQLLVNSTAGTSASVFDNAVNGKGSFVCIIKSTTGHVFGAYVEDTFGVPGNWIPGSPNNFLFSLKDIPPQRVVKLKRSAIGNGVHITNCGLHMGNDGAHALIAFCSHSTVDSSPAFELAPGYESVGSRTLHGQFGAYTPEFMEVFALSS